MGNGKVEELISYNQLLEHLENAQDHDMGMDQELYRFRAIIGHQGPLLASDPDWKGSKYNVQVEWETGEITFEPLSIIAADDPVTCAAYAKENDLLALEGWRRFRSLAKKDKVLARAIKQSKIRQVRRSQTPVDWYSKKQATVETATYGSEFVAAKTATEQIMDIRQTLRYLGAPITTKSFLSGDNRSVVTSATLPHSTLTKRHNILAFHRVREAIAAKLMAFYWIQSAYNLSDMLSKHWDHPTVYPMISKFLITRGNITLIPREATEEKEKEILNPQPEKNKKNQNEIKI